MEIKLQQPPQDLRDYLLVNDFVPIYAWSAQETNYGTCHYTGYWNAGILLHVRHNPTYRHDYHVGYLHYMHMRGTHQSEERHSSCPHMLVNGDCVFDCDTHSDSYLCTPRLPYISKLLQIKSCFLETHVLPHLSFHEQIQLPMDIIFHKPVPITLQHNRYYWTEALTLSLNEYLTQSGQPTGVDVGTGIVRQNFDGVRYWSKAGEHALMCVRTRRLAFAKTAFQLQEVLIQALLKFGCTQIERWATAIQDLHLVGGRSDTQQLRAGFSATELIVWGEYTGQCVAKWPAPMTVPPSLQLTVRQLAKIKN